MLETIVHLGQALASIRVIDPNTTLPESSSDNSRQPEQSGEATRSAAEIARQSQEREQIAQLLDHLNDVAGQLREQRHALLQEMQQVAIELAMAVASQAIYTKIQAGEFPIESLVQAAIKRLNSAGPIVIHLHPDDLSLLNRRLEDGRSQIVGGDVRFESDASMSRGDCRADTGELGVWCKMQSQIEQMRERVLECLGDAEIERRKTTGSDSGLRRFPDRRQTA